MNLSEKFGELLIHISKEKRIDHETAQFYYFILSGILKAGNLHLQSGHFRIQSEEIIRRLGISPSAYLIAKQKVLSFNVLKCEDGSANASETEEEGEGESAGGDQECWSFTEYFFSETPEIAVITEKGSA